MGAFIPAAIGVKFTMEYKLGKLDRKIFKITSWIKMSIILSNTKWSHLNLKQHGYESRVLYWLVSYPGQVT